MRIHFIKDDKQYIAFNCDTLDIKIVSEEEKRKLQSLCDSKAAPYGEEPEKGFSTLVLHVSNTCNMKCQYCFANHGTYGSAAEIMKPQTGVDAVEAFYKKFRTIGEIKFFGGEPLYAEGTIRAVCAYVTEKFRRGEISEMPVLRIITNGTIMTEPIMEMIQTYHIKVIFSIDGVEDIHDKLRIDAKSEGTYRIVRSNFMKLRAYTDGKQPQGIDLTYTAVHIREGWSIPAVTERLAEEFGIRPGKINVSMVTVDNDSSLFIEDTADCHRENIRTIMQSAENGNPHCADQKTQAMINRIKSKRLSPNRICSAGQTWSAVSVRGEVYPCLMFMDEKELMLGSIYQCVFEDERWKRFHDRWSAYDRTKKERCSKCPYVRICHSCMGINRFYTGRFEAVDESRCRSMREGAEMIIRGIAHGIL